MSFSRFLKKEISVSNTCINVTSLIIYMKKILDFDWPRAVQFKCNNSAKSLTPVQKKSVTPVQIANKSKNLKTN